MKVPHNLRDLYAALSWPHLLSRIGIHATARSRAYAARNCDIASTLSRLGRDAALVLSRGAPAFVALVVMSQQTLEATLDVAPSHRLEHEEVVEHAGRVAQSTAAVQPGHGPVQSRLHPRQHHVSDPEWGRCAVRGRVRRRCCGGTEESVDIARRQRRQAAGTRVVEHAFLVVGVGDLRHVDGGRAVQVHAGEAGERPAAQAGLDGVDPTSSLRPGSLGRRHSRPHRVCVASCRAVLGPLIGVDVRQTGESLAQHRRIGCRRPFVVGGGGARERHGPSLDEIGHERPIQRFRLSPHCRPLAAPGLPAALLSLFHAAAGQITHIGKDKARDIPNGSVRLLKWLD